MLKRLVKDKYIQWYRANEHSNFFFDCVFLCPTIRLWSLFKVRHVMGALIMTYSRPLLRASYEVILHPPSIWLRQKLYPLWGIELGTFRSWVVCSNRSARELWCFGFIFCYSWNIYFVFSLLYNYSPMLCEYIIWGVIHHTLLLIEVILFYLTWLTMSVCSMWL